MTTIIQAFRDLVDKGGAIILAVDLNDKDEVQNARYEKRYYTNDDNVGFVRCNTERLSIPCLSKRS